jgi:hypothetical protein
MADEHDYPAVDKPPLSQVFDWLILEYGKEQVKKMAKKKCKGKSGQPEKHDDDYLLFLIEMRVQQGEKRRTAIRQVLTRLGLANDDKRVEQVRQLSITRARCLAQFIKAHIQVVQVTDSVPAGFPKAIFDVA